MTNTKERLAIAAALMLMAGTAFAQTTSGGSGSFSNLSPGNQKIARALFNAQSAQNGSHPLSLNQIAALKGDEGWGRVFKEMKAEGLVHEKNLGQVVSSYEHHLHGDTSSTGRTIVTTGSGRSFASGSDHGHAETGKVGDVGSESAEHGSGAIAHGHDAVTVSTAGGATNAGGAAVSSPGGGGSHGGGAGHAR